jgi:broad specificity polyphosphatase/5'/3'-nucleotidase SurE
LTDYEKYARFVLKKWTCCDSSKDLSVRRCFEKKKKGEMSWETRAVRRIRKRVRNRMSKKRNKSQKTSLINFPKENLDRKHGVKICAMALPV